MSLLWVHLDLQASKHVWCRSGGWMWSVRLPCWSTSTIVWSTQALMRSASHDLVWSMPCAWLSTTPPPKGASCRLQLAPLRTKGHDDTPCGNPLVRRVTWAQGIGLAADAGLLPPFRLTALFFPFCSTTHAGTLLYSCFRCIVWCCTR